MGRISSLDYHIMKEAQLVISPEKVPTQHSVKIWQDQIPSIIRNKGLCHIFKPTYK